MLGSPDAAQRLLADAGLRGRAPFTLLFGTSAALRPAPSTTGDWPRRSNPR